MLRFYGIVRVTVGIGGAVCVVRGELFGCTFALILRLSRHLAAILARA